jgi:hypothetical protein
LLSGPCAAEQYCSPLLLLLLLLSLLLLTPAGTRGIGLEVSMSMALLHS